MPAGGSRSKRDGLKGRDLVAITDFSRREVERVFQAADGMKRFTKTGTDLLKRRVICTMFFEPSTRTRLSFETAMVRLGGSAVGFADPSSARVVTGESLADTVRMGSSYANVIVLRHKIEGAAKLAAEVSDVPVLNGGDGSHHHPTQTLTDMYTISRELGGVDGVKIALLGDLRQTRSAMSLAIALTMFRNVELFLVSPPALRMRKEVLDQLDGARVRYHQLERVDDVLGELDVLYVNRLQKERFADPAEYERLKGSYFITRKMLEGARSEMIVMHHLPRIDDIPLDIDSTRHARYFQQAANGLPVRMALLSEVVE
ncbi:MAG: aspartate carbamoyltransferase [Thaumarchaeota archaeon]|nr:aspartate carbamoyltransferase [Nitrososphaerota archaeon]